MEILHAENCCCNEKDYFLFISGKDDTKVVVNYISTNCKCIQAKYELDIADGDDYQSIKNKKAETGTGKLKAGIFDLFGIKPSKKRYDLCNFLKTFCVDNEICYQFINTTTLDIASILLGADITAIESNLTLVHIIKTGITVIDLESNSDGLIIKKQISLNLDCNDKVFKDAVTKGKKASKIILSFDDSSTHTRQVENILKSSKQLVVLAKNYSNFILKALEVMVNDLIGGCKSQLKILPYLECDLFITKQQQSSDRCYGSFVIKRLKNTKIPFNGAIDAFVAENEIVVANIWNGKSLEALTITDVTEYTGSRILIILFIDANGFHNLHIKSAENVTIFAPPRERKQDAYINFDNEDGDGKISITIPVIGKLKDESDNATIPPYISFFDNGMPVIGQQAQNLSAQHPSFVVYDIFTLTKMAAATSTIKTNPKWKFKVAKDSNGTLQIIFITWRGT